MKKPLSDLAFVAIVGYLGKVQFVRKFLRLWGTTTIDDVEVLVRKHYTWPKRLVTEEDHDLYRFLKIDEEITNIKSSDMDGVENAWIYLNPAKHRVVKKRVRSSEDVEWGPWKTTYDPPPYTNTVLKEYDVQEEGARSVNDAIIASAFNEIIEEANNNVTGTIYISALSAAGMPSITANITDQELVAQQIVDNVETLWETCLFRSNYYSTDLYKDAMFRYLLRSETVDYTIDSVRMSTTTLAQTTNEYNSGISAINNLWTATSPIGTTVNNVVVPVYEVTVTITENFFSSSTDLVDLIANDINAAADVSLAYDPFAVIRNTAFTTTATTVNPNVITTLTAASAISEDYMSSGIYTAMRPATYTLWSFSNSGEPVNPELWHKSGNKWYLRADTLTNKVLSWDEKVDLVTHIIDSDYAEEDTSFWEDLLTVLVFVAIFIVSFLYPPLGIAAKGIFAAAFGITMAALAVQVLGFVHQLAGNSSGVISTQKFLVAINPLVVVAQIIQVFNFVQQTFQKLKELGAKVLVQEATAKSLAEAGKEVIADTIKVTAKQIAAEMVKHTATELVWEGIKSYAITFVKNIGFKQLLQVASTITDVVMRNDIKSLQKEFNKLQEQVDEYQEANESSLMRDYGQAYLATYAYPLQNDWSHYAYDTPYEPTSGPLHTGNIAATKFKALKPGNYSYMKVRNRKAMQSSNPQANTLKAEDDMKLTYEQSLMF